MSPKERQEVAVKIKEALEQVREEIARLRELTKPIAPENAIGRVSRMDAINNKSVNEAALRKAVARFRGLESALGRVDEDHFGRCRHCGDEIPAGRLLLLPESVLCVKCASRR